MNINCTSNCLHQHDGNCTLTELPEGFTSAVQVSRGEVDTDCMYYESV